MRLEGDAMLTVVVILLLFLVIFFTPFIHCEAVTVEAISCFVGDCHVMAPLAPLLAMTSSIL